MLRRKKGNSGPGLGAVSVDVTGWTPGQSDSSRQTWYQPGASLWLCYFPIPPDLPHAVGDYDALHRELERSAGQGDMAVIETDWVDVVQDVVAAQIVLKGRMAQGPATYIGSLIVPFADRSWVIRMQAVEGSPTGLRASLWLDSYLGQGGDLNVLESARPGEPAGGDATGGARRTPSDDLEWDDIVPGHPPSRVRAWLPTCRQNLRLDPEVLSLARFV